MKITIDEKRLYELIQHAVEEAIGKFILVKPSRDDILAREKALKELRAGDAIDWEDFRNSSNEL
jgi:hypothetical protein